MSQIRGCLRLVGVLWCWAWTLTFTLVVLHSILFHKTFKVTIDINAYGEGVVESIMLVLSTIAGFDFICHEARRLKNERRLRERC